MNEAWSRHIEEITGAGTVLCDEPMSRHTTFRIGGPADLFVKPETTEHIMKVIRVCREEGIPFFVLGNGSNLLVSDEGFRGLVIQLEHNYSQCRVVGGTSLAAKSGLYLTTLAQQARELGLTGLEYASGIPGTVGGAVLMNAGAYNGEIADSLTEALVLKQDGELTAVTRDELDLGYRHSRAMDEGWVILSAVFSLTEGDPEKIEARMNELRDLRQSKQPLEYASAGSTFKRPRGSYAGKLIMEAGLAGRSVGGAQVSEKHSGFIINRGNATASDVRALIDEVQERVLENSGIRLEPEVRFLGF